MTRRDTPEQWKPLLERHGIHSGRKLAEKLNVSIAAAIRLLHGESSSRDTIDAAAELLQVAPEEIRRLRGEVPLPPFRLPRDAERLNPKQRAAVVAVVRAMLEPDDAASMNEPEVTAARARLLAAEAARASGRKRKATGK